MQDLLPYETLASLWKRQTPTSIVIWRLFPSCGLRPLTTKKKKKQTNPNITNLSPLMTRWQPPQPKLPSPAPDIGACPRQSMKGGWRWVWLRTRGCWERSLFGESLPSRGPLPPFFLLQISGVYTSISPPSSLWQRRQSLKLLVENMCYGVNKFVRSDV